MPIIIYYNILLNKCNLLNFWNSWCLFPFWYENSHDTVLNIIEKFLFCISNFNLYAPYCISKEVLRKVKCHFENLRTCTRFGGCSFMNSIHEFCEILYPNKNFGTSCTKNDMHLLRMSRFEQFWNTNCACHDIHSYI